MSARACASTFEHGDVGRGVGAEDRGLHPIVVREADLDLARARDDVVVRDDVARLVDHEAGALRWPSCGPKSGFDSSTTVARICTTPGAASR